MNKLKAIEYLVKNNVYGDEWSGAGMYVIIAKIIDSKQKKFTEKELKKWLKYASSF